MKSVWPSIQYHHVYGLSGSFGNIGRLKNNYQYWTTEYIYTNGRPTGLAAAFLAYRSNAVGLDDPADAGSAPATTRAIRAGRGCVRGPALSSRAVPKKAKDKEL
jgi:hypothetical protein